MRPKLSLAGWGILCAVMVSTNAQAEDSRETGKVYFAAAGGFNRPTQANWSDGNNDGDYSSKLGFALIGGIGYQVSRHLRFEIEPGYRNSTINSTSLTGTKIDGSGRITSESLMANMLIDFPLWGEISPYIGGGVGVAHIHTRLSGTTFEFAGLPATIEGSDTVLSYQAIVGVGVQLNPAVTLTLDYRYFSARTPSFNDAIGANFETENHNHAVMVGFRLAL